MYILGISAYYHDSAACLIKDGKILSAAQEERFTRKKHDASFPRLAILSCIKEANITPKDIDHVVFYEKPFLKFERLLETYLAFAPRGFKSFSQSMPLWVKDKIFQKSIIINELGACLGNKQLWEERLLFSEHHLSHAASAFYPSKFEESAILTMDGVGEWTTTSLSFGSSNKIEVLKEINFPHSLGLLYSAFTYYLGFKVNSGEYKVMGLAPYGKPIYSDLIKENLIHIKKDGSFSLDLSYFNYCTGLTMTSERFHTLFGGAPRSPESELTQNDMDVAASIQKVIEEVVIKLAIGVKQYTGANNLCLAGGVALNCVANGALLREEIFEDIWIQPAAGDAGGALGAALAVYYLSFNEKREVSKDNDSMNGSYLGPKFSDTQVKDELECIGANFKEYSHEEIIDKTAHFLDEGKAIGWMQGRMEFGPRALGSRSIIADPRSPNMQKLLNLKIKYRESFRPFAPSILNEYKKDWFNLEKESPYMLFVSEINDEKRILNEDESLFGIDKLNIKRSIVPAITHIDYSARIQTVHKQTNPVYHSLITKFYELTNCPMVVNTSFNVRGEPIVCTPEDAFNCFMGTELDVLVINNFLMIKSKQDPQLIKSYEKEYELD